jgi:hypothetical protein
MKREREKGSFVIKKRRRKEREERFRLKTENIREPWKKRQIVGSS